MTRPIVKSRYDSHRALSKVSRAHASKVAFKTGMPLSKEKWVRWLTRKTGTDEQRGKHFPILGSKADLPKLRYRKPTALEKARLTKLELDTAKEERDLLDAGFKGWLIGVKYKDGSTEEIPIIAKNYTEALRKARPKMNQAASQMDEIVIIDPSIGEILHKVGAGARRAAHAIARGVKMVPGIARRVYRAGEREALKAARRLGRISALPAEIGEAYEIGAAYRPGIVPAEAEAGEPARRVLTPDEASRLVAEAVRGAPLAAKEKAEIEKAPMLYRPREEPMPEWYTPAAISAARERIAARIAGRPIKAFDPRALRPFGIPMREYQLQSYHPGSHEEYEEHRVSRIQAARRKAAWKERAPVKIES
jgi:hypothetical protein